jgi:hypothetical protein
MSKHQIVIIGTVPYQLRARTIVEITCEGYPEQVVPYRGGLRVTMADMRRVFRTEPGAYFTLGPYRGHMGKRGMRVGCARITGEKLEILRRWARSK